MSETKPAQLAETGTDITRFNALRQGAIKDGRAYGSNSRRPV
jgi:hypothetical protein